MTQEATMTISRLTSGAGTVFARVGGFRRGATGGGGASVGRGHGGGACDGAGPDGEYF